MTTRTFLLIIALSALDGALLVWLFHVARRPVEACSEARILVCGGVELTVSRTPRGFRREHLVCLAVVAILLSIAFMSGIYKEIAR